MPQAINEGVPHVTRPLSTSWILCLAVAALVAPYIWAVSHYHTLHLARAVEEDDLMVISSGPSGGAYRKAAEAVQDALDSALIQNQSSAVSSKTQIGEVGLIPKAL